MIENSLKDLLVNLDNDIKAMSERYVNSPMDEANKQAGLSKLIRQRKVIVDALAKVTAISFGE